MIASLPVLALALGSAFSTDLDGLAHHGVSRAVQAILAHAASNSGNIDLKFSVDDDEDEDGDQVVDPEAIRETVRESLKGLPGNIEVHVPKIDISIPRAPMPPVPPVPPEPPSGDVKLRKFSLHTKDAPAVDVLHRIAQSAGWSLTVAGVGDEKVSLDINDVDPREAVRRVLKSSRSWAVLRGDRLVVIAANDAGVRAGELIERRGRSARIKGSKQSDLVHVMQGDLVVPRGTVVQGDAVVVGGTLTVEPGALVQGDAVSVLGGIDVEPGGVVMGDSVAVVGTVNVEPGGQVMGAHTQVGAGKIFGSHRSRRRSFFDKVGFFGLFPTLALFALIYLVGLIALLAAPDRLRGIGATLIGQPVRSFFIGFLSWLLLLPLAILLCVTLVGIPLLPLLPLLLFVSFALGLAAIALRIGEILPAGPGQKFVPTAALGMGMGVLALVAFVPIVGIMALVVVQFAAVGSVVASRAGRAIELPPGSTPATV